MIYSFSMNVKYRSLEDMLMNTLHTLDTDTDNVTRLENAQRLLRIVRTRLTDIRNQAAYDARETHTTTQIADLTGIDRKAVEQYSNTWAEKKGLPRRRERRNRPWQVGYTDLSGDRCAPQRRTDPAQDVIGETTAEGYHRPPAGTTHQTS